MFRSDLIGLPGLAALALSRAMFGAEYDRYAVRVRRFGLL